jgi:small-conductance mechanosensitive channel
MPSFSEISDSLARQMGMAPENLSRILLTALALVFFTLAQRLIRRALAHNIEDRAVRYNAFKVLGYITGIIALAVIARIWIEGIAGLSTYLGLLSAGLAVALAEVVANLVGFGFILWRRPFEVGDRIEIAGLTGDVVDIRLFQFTLLEVGNWVKADQSTGRVIHVPNGWVFKHAQANFNRGLEHVWNEIAITITFESNWRRAKDVLTRILAESPQVAEETVKARIDAASNRYFINYTNLTPIVWTSVAADGVVLTLRYLCDPRRRRSSASDLWERILDEFGPAADIDFAYPTQRKYDNPTEGKPGARAVLHTTVAGGPSLPALAEGAARPVPEIVGEPAATGATPPHFVPTSRERG